MNKEGKEENSFHGNVCAYLTCRLMGDPDLVLHMCELRTMPQGHPDYRFICQEIWRKIQEVHPTLAESGKFVDWQKYRLGRLQSEMRTEFKKSGMKNRK